MKRKIFNYFDVRYNILALDKYYYSASVSIFKKDLFSINALMKIIPFLPSLS